MAWGFIGTLAIASLCDPKSLMDQGKDVDWDTLVADADSMNNSEECGTHGSEMGVLIAHSIVDGVRALAAKGRCGDVDSNTLPPLLAILRPAFPYPRDEPEDSGASWTNLFMRCMSYQGDAAKQASHESNTSLVLDVNRLSKHDATPQSSRVPFPEEAGWPSGYLCQSRWTLGSTHSRTLHRMVTRLKERPFQTPFTISGSLLQQIAREAIRPLLEAYLLPPSRCGVQSVQQRDAESLRTPLHVAAELGDLWLVRELLSLGASATSADKWGMVPAHLAARRGFKDVVAELENVVPSPADLEGRSPADVLSLLQPSRSNVLTDNGCYANDDDGGWPTETLVETGPYTCDFASVAAADISPDDFGAKYMSIGRPVRIIGGALKWSIRQLRASAFLNGEWGDLQFPLSTVPYSSVYGGERQNLTTLRAFTARVLDGEVSCAADHESCIAPYIFVELDDTSIEILRSPLKDVRNPHVLSKQQSDLVHMPQLYVGPAGSGAPMHFHGSALNALAYGRKRWLLAPPWIANFSTIPGPRYYRSSDARDSSLHVCDQLPGDIIYVPTGWGHAVVNIQTSVGVALNFLDDHTSF